LTRAPCRAASGSAWRWRAFVADAPVLIPETEVLSDLIGTIHHTTLVCLLNRSIGAVAGSLQYLLKV
jgi:hypothetical protein